ncbi:hypothetical protein [Acidipila sp. EB88]|uniref:hypothetical protein n=1 Tax=Acidipila sp. EB88 TaxID=2305226 RepID=UPI000F5E4A85|nr:hypothetical protein [Acidipila sp. EB88]
MRIRINELYPSEIALAMLALVLVLWASWAGLHRQSARLGGTDRATHGARSPQGKSARQVVDSLHNSSD